MSKRQKYSKKNFSFYGRSDTQIKRSPITSQTIIYKSPFTLAGSQPKIPDGKCYQSCGVRLQAAAQYTNVRTNAAGVVDTAETMHFLVVPCVTNGIMAKGANATGGGANGSTTGPTSSIGFGKHIEGAVINRDNANPALGQVFQQTPSNAIEHWRICSHAARFTLVNSYDENDGWFEAVRIPWTRVEELTTWTFDGVSGRLEFDGEGFPNYTNLNNDALVSHPTYVTGKLTEIHKYLFQLRASNDDHEFVELNYQPYNNEISGLFDRSFDAIYVRVHGRSSTNTSLMCHVVSNQELLYESSSKLARFHTQSQYSQAAMNTIRKANVYGNSKAGKIMTS